MEKNCSEKRIYQSLLSTVSEPEFFIVDTDDEGYPIPHDTAGYFDVEPIDKGTDFRRELTINLQELGFEVEASHHEVGPGQNEIAFKFDDALKTADAVITFKQAIKAIVANMAEFDGLDYRVTFMPKPFFGEPGSGMHCHQSLFKDGENIFADDTNESGLSQEAMWFIGGLLKHSAAITAITNPIVNSYKRLVPGYEAPVYITYGLQNRSALIRVPAARGKGTRIEYRSPDPTCNPYLAFAVMLEAGMDGIKNKIDPGEPNEINIYELTEEEREEQGIGENTLPKNKAARQVLKAAIAILAPPESFIKAYRVTVFASPSLSHGRILGNGASNNCKAAAEAISIAIKANLLTLFLFISLFLGTVLSAIIDLQHLLPPPKPCFPLKAQSLLHLAHKLSKHS